jgi:hypothetical protein
MLDDVLGVYEIGVRRDIRPAVYYKLVVRTYGRKRGFGTKLYAHVFKLEGGI